MIGKRVMMGMRWRPRRRVVAMLAAGLLVPGVALASTLFVWTGGSFVDGNRSMVFSTNAYFFGRHVAPP